MIQIEQLQCYMIIFTGQVNTRRVFTFYRAPEALPFSNPCRYYNDDDDDDDDDNDDNNNNNSFKRTHPLFARGALQKVYPKNKLENYLKN